MINTPDGFAIELFWSAPRPAVQVDEWLKRYKDSVDAPARQPLVDTMRDLQVQRPIKTFLEVGCHCGPAYRRIVRDVPELAGVPFLGIDASADAIAEAQIWNADFQEAEWLRASIRGGLPFLDDKVADVTYTSTLLASIPPEELDGVMATLFRITSRALVIYEPPVARVGSGGFKEWAHDYDAAAARVARGFELIVYNLRPPT